MNAGAVAEIAETLPPEPASASRARRLVREVLERHGHEELVDSATLLVSEVVTNAVLHAGTSIGLRCRIGTDVVRLEISDGSSVLPSIRHYDEIASTGRGLSLVAALSQAWGLVPDEFGKTVWFEFRSEPVGDDEPAAAQESIGPDERTVRLLGAPTALVQATIEYGDSILRELALLALSGEIDEELPDGWHLPRIDVTPILAAAEEARLEGRAHADLELHFPVSSGAEAVERLRLIDCADAFARAGRLLSAPALPEIGVCRHWIYSSINEQLLGASPEAWELPEHLEPTQEAATLPDSAVAEIEAAVIATIVADDANRILVVNETAGALLGWNPEELCGQRLVTIIPPELREAHLAGFSRLQLTGESRILGQSVEVPALRRNGSRIDVFLMIEPMTYFDGRTSYRASLFPL